VELTKTYRRINCSDVFFVFVFVILLTGALTLITTIVAASVSGAS
jgi:hypothetical protein